MKKLILITCLLIALLGMARNVVAAPFGYGSDDAGNIHKIDLGNGEIISSFYTGINFHGLAIDPTGTTLYGSTGNGLLYSMDILPGLPLTLTNITLIGDMGLGTVEAIDFNGELWAMDDDTINPTIWSIDISIGQTTATLSKTFVQQALPFVFNKVQAMAVNANSITDVWIAIQKFPMDFQSIDTNISPPGPNITDPVLLGGFSLPPAIMGMDMADEVLYGLGGVAFSGGSFAKSGGIYSITINEVNAQPTLIKDTNHNWLGLAAVDTAATTIVALDIKPGSCPNPLNVKSRGLLPVAILGTEGFEVSTINKDTINLNGVTPVKSNFENVTAPSGLPSGSPFCDCEIFLPDTYEDLVLKFNTQEIVATLGEVSDGAIIELTLTGNLLDEFGGTAFEGKDCVLIKIKGKK